MSMTRAIFLCAALLVSAGAAHAADFTARVIAVMDGDTLMVTDGGKPKKVRLAGVDAPEKSQPYGATSQQSLSEMVAGKTVTVIPRAKDDYGRIVAEVVADGVNVNREQVRRGMAWEYSRFHSNRELMALQREAQSQRLGLWAGDGIVEPSQWRKQHPSIQAVPAQPAASAAMPAADPACAGKRRCAQMTSCEEARHYLALCGPESLDGDRDGVPCEKLCVGKK